MTNKAEIRPMDPNKDHIIGIVGGMGPEAGIHLFNRILYHTPASADQDHLPVMLMSFPGQIVDRTAFLEGTASVNPAYSVARIIEKLEKAGAKTVGIACNTSHSPAIFDVIVKELEKAGSRVQLLHMPYETCKLIKEKYPDVRRVGLMATNGTYRSGIYDTLLRSQGFQPVIPEEGFQNDIIHRMVYDPVFGLKGNACHITPQVLSLMEKALLLFKREGAEAVILGCTEFSLVGDQFSSDHLLIDSTEALALALVREATKGEIKLIRKLNYL